LQEWVLTVPGTLGIGVMKFKKNILNKTSKCITN
jgi:hypothetical protein